MSARSNFNQSVETFNRDLNTGAPVGVVSNDGLTLGLAGFAYGEASSPIFVGGSDLAQVARLYVAAFDRSPDAAGLQAWTGSMQAGLTLPQIATDFLAVPEGVARFGAVSNSGFVADLYWNVLGRAPDATGAAFWGTALATGEISRGGVLASFANSQEFKA
jgi:Domain of unknown function (DUF4214)